MPDFELLKGRAGGTRYLAVRPPLREFQYRAVASALSIEVTENGYITSQVGCSTEFSWEDRPMPLALEELDQKARAMVEALSRLGYTAAVLNDEAIFLDGPADMFTQFEKQYATG